jgi:hypothetical protein
MTVTDTLAFFLMPFAACVAFVLIHAYFGVQVLRRNVIFADLALAQLSALGRRLLSRSAMRRRARPALAMRSCSR